jgi:hypothetical protein
MFHAFHIEQTERLDAECVVDMPELEDGRLALG